MSEFTGTMTNTMTDDAKTTETIEIREDGLGLCPRCQKPLMTGRYGIYCPERCGFHVTRRVFGEPISEEQQIALLHGEEIFVEGIISKRTGKPYSVYVKANGLREYTYTRSDGTEATGWDFELERRFPDKKE